LIRGGFLGEDRKLAGFSDVLEFMSRHEEDLDEKTKKIISDHTDVLQFLILATPKSLH
jgi:hypothetical protein